MPKSKAQYDKMKEKRKKDMIVAATTIFAFNNYNNVTIDDIATKLKCSHGLFYHYFNNKEELFIEVMNEAIKVGKKYVYIHQEEDKTCMSKIRKIIDIILKITKEKNDYHIACLYLLLNLRLQIDNVPQTEEFHFSCLAATNKFAELIEGAQKDGDAYEGDVGEMVVALVSLLEGLFFNRLMVGHKKYHCPTTDIIIRLLEKKDGKN